MPDRLKSQTKRDTVIIIIILIFLSEVEAKKINQENKEEGASVI